MNSCTAPSSDGVPARLLPLASVVLPWEEGSLPQLTKRWLNSWAPQTGQEVLVWDDRLPGFGIRAYPSGRRAWVIQYRVGRASRRLLLGTVAEVTPDAARRLARLHLSAVLAGRDPSAERRLLRAAETVSELCTRYLELHAKPRKRSWRDDEQRFRAYVVPRLGRMREVEVKRADVRAFHHWTAERTGRYAANRTLALVSHLFSWGEKEGVLPEGHPNPARGVDRFEERARDRWLGPDEVGRVVRSLASEPSAHVRAYFLLALLLGTRKRELLRLRWSDIDTERWTARLPETKSGRPHELPLGRQAREILGALPKAHGNPHVFPGRFQGESLSVPTIDQAWRRIRVEAGVPDARLHDLRRTLGSWVVQQTGSLALVGALLNHSDPRVTAEHYARFADGHRRSALDAHGDAVLSAAGMRASTLVLDAGAAASSDPRSAPEQ